MSFLKNISGIFRRKKGSRFGEIAVKKGLASEKDIEEALKAQREYDQMHKTHKKIGAILTEKGILTPDDVTLILEEQRKDQSLMAWFYAFFNLSH